MHNVQQTEYPEVQEMEISYLHEFAVLADTGNYMEAAEKLFLTQSTLTRHIQSLEKDLGASVFDRSTRHIDLSEYGKILLPYARQISSLQEEYQTKIYNQQRVDKGNLRIGSIPTMAAYRITNLIAEFQHIYPDISVDVLETDYTNMYNMLMSGQCDFAFLREYDQSDPALEEITITKDHIVAIMAENSPVSRQAEHLSIELGKMKGQHFLLIGRDSMMYKICLAACRKAGFEPIVGYTSHHATNLLGMARLGNGIALLTEKPILNQDLSGLAVFDVLPRIETRINTAWKKDRKLSAAALLFRDFILGKQEKGELALF